ncbi:S-layer homology domain-containing protein [Candidatus Gracilibacteria bacterium]|jgi:hypothetical protein|nr:S-layer homology domain-containing protein [Candidatus Gracilibacteria bacterium]
MNTSKTFQRWLRTCAVWVVSSVVLVPVVSAFDDIASVGSELHASITALTDKNIIRGYADSTFRPNQLITEKEWALLVLRKDQSSPNVAAYSNLPITRLAALRLLAEQWQLPWLSESAVSLFTDVPTEDSAVVNFFFHSGIIHGYENHQFKPYQSLTRAEAAKVLYLSLQFWAPEVLSSSCHPSCSPSPVPTPTSVPTAVVGITQSVVRIVDVSPTSFGPGDQGSVLFTLSNNGRPLTGMQYGDEYMVSVLSGSIDIDTVSEIGNGLYQIFFHVRPQAAPGPINIRITAFVGDVFSTDINEFLNAKNQVVVSSPTVSLAQLVPQTLGASDTAQIIVSPRGINGSSVSGLDIDAYVSKGSGTITSPVVESPAGSGVYIGTFKASTVRAQSFEITVRINNVGSRPQTTITGYVR